jgi:hypothetical protein
MAATARVRQGDGGSTRIWDDGGQDPQAFGAYEGRNPQEDIGAFRAQLHEQSVAASFCAQSVDGHGYPSNPCLTTATRRRSSSDLGVRVRNPFAFTVRPGLAARSGESAIRYVYIGNAAGRRTRDGSCISGWTQFRLAVYEGPATSVPYQGAIPPHDAATRTESEPAFARSRHGTTTDANQCIPPGFLGNARSAACSTPAPAIPRRTRAATSSATTVRAGQAHGRRREQSVLQILDFANNAAGPVDFATNR